MTSQRHVIKKQILDLQVSSNIKTFELQNKISALYRSKIIPLIDTYCSQLSDPDQIHRIDRLEIDLGEIDLQNLEADLVAKVTEQLYPQLAAKLNSLASAVASANEEVSHRDRQIAHSKQAHAPTTDTDSSRKATTSQLELLGYFLSTGHLPWWCEPLTTEALENCFEDLLEAEPEALKSLLTEQIKHLKFLQRLIYQFSDNILRETVALLAPVWASWVQSYIRDIEILLPQIAGWRDIAPRQFRLTLWQSIFLQLSLSPNPSSQLDKFIQNSLYYLATDCDIDVRSLFLQIRQAIEQLSTEGVRFDSELPKFFATHSTREQGSRGQGAGGRGEIPIISDQVPDSINAIAQYLKFQPDSLASTVSSESINYAPDPFSNSEEIYIQNAGLVLLWPFLNRFFTGLNLVQSNHFIDLQKSKRAVLFLQYLVGASSVIPEHLLPLNKLLCGLDLSDPIEAKLDITEQEQTECNNLLLAVIQHWSALKSTSPQGFRQAFLNRAGILRINNGNWLLQVEQKTHDVLLDRLPWSINLVKLPWMDELLSVDWI